jgi:protoporphyrinogen oxidase
LEQDAEVGGLAGSFPTGGQRLEKFYHHWFTSDEHIMQLVRELGTEDRIIYRPTRTGMYMTNSFFKLSTPLDILRFPPLGLVDRVRLARMVLGARLRKNWQELENVTAEEWVIRASGREVYRVVWEPLLRGKFGPFAKEVSAVWLWNKLKLRGGSRDKTGTEILAYYRGGFAALADHLAAKIRDSGGEIRRGVAVTSLIVERGRIKGIHTSQGPVEADAVIATPALPIIARLVEPHVHSSYTERLRRIRYLANICLVLELDRSLSEIYWLNVNDPEFPFVGVIEHTNFEPAGSYAGRHIVYLSKYVSEDASVFNLTDAGLLDYSLPYIRQMFSQFRRDWIQRWHVWRATYAQPVVLRGYRDLIPPAETPVAGFYIATMAQIYPQDRGTNYAVASGRAMARKLLALSLGPARRVS